MTDDPIQQAQAFFNAGNFQRSRELALQGLEDRPDNLELLRLAGRASLELNLDASPYFEKVVHQSPADVQAWHELGDALMDEGNLAEAAAAFRQAVTLRPQDAAALVDLGHIVLALGQLDEAVSYLSQASRLAPGSLSTLRSLTDMYRRAGNLPAALETAQQITQFQPGDVLATMDVGDLSLAMGDFDQSVTAYQRLREIDDNEEHEVYAYHGMIQAEMARDRWRRALDLSIDATKVDRFGLTTDLLAYTVAQVFGASERPAPSRAEVDAALTAELAEHRRLHTEELAV